MNVKSLGILYSQLGFGPNDKIIADYADKKAIDTLDDGFTEETCDAETLKLYPQMRRGFFMERCIKGPDSITNTIDTMDGMELYAVEEDESIWNEILMRVYNQNKAGEYTNEPAPGFDHALDGWGYVIMDRKKGDYGISRSN